jgi:hypothetical protein
MSWLNLSGAFSMRASPHRPTDPDSQSGTGLPDEPTDHKARILARYDGDSNRRFSEAIVSL